MLHFLLLINFFLYKNKKQNSEYMIIGSIVHSILHLTNFIYKLLGASHMITGTVIIWLNKPK